jgi:hypothetical protein
MPTKTKPARTRKNQRVALQLHKTKRNKFSQLYQLEDIHRLGGRGIEFEHFIGYLYEQQGYEVKTTPRTADHGVDLVLYKDGQKYVVQCKHYRPDRKVDFAPVQQLLGALHGEKAHRAFFVTNSSFTEQGINWAKNQPIDLIDGQQLEKMAYRINQIEIKSFVRKSLPDWLSLKLEALRRLFNRYRRWVTILTLYLVIALLLMAGVGLWLVFSSGQASPKVSQVPTARPTLPQSSNSLSLTPLETVTTLIPVTATMPPTVPPLPTARLKDATSSPCYVGQVKGNSKTKFYHEPGWPYYNSFKPNDPTIVCFDSAITAQAAGYKPGQQPATPKPAR